MSKNHYSDYDEDTTARCERALVTLLGDVGPWGNRIYLAGVWRLATSLAACPRVHDRMSARPMSTS
ncbi:hypothetical protein [Mycolicibacter sinensis]|uniref:hypothetical protein n=1 Tax=Mycolicibacter sinensis (strain JDM601) TaxID=875328 RepID=UPI0002DA2BC0|nr:hypothetical protein [Mycolicibacter sinensis]